METAPRTAPLPLWAVLGIAAAAAAAALLFFLGFDEPFTLHGDNKLVHFPMKLDAWRQWTSGQLPAWSSGLWSGFPLLGDPTTGVWYLPHALAFLATPAPHLRAFDVATALHVGWLAAGSAVLLRRLGAGAAGCALAAVTAPLLSHVLGWTAYLPGFSALAWWPWVLVGADRLACETRDRLPLRALVLASLPLGAQVLAGYPELGLYSGCMAAAWILATGKELSATNRVLRVAALAGAAALLAGPQLVPGALSALDSVRDDILDVPAVLAVQGSPLDVIAPRSPAGVFAILSPFVGAATLALACVAVLRRTRGSAVLAGIALVAALLALGDRTPSYGLLARLPLFDLFRGPHKFFLATQLATSWLAALGLDGLPRRPERTRLATALALALAAAVVAEHAASFASHVPRVASGHTKVEMETSEAMKILEPVATAIEDASSGPPRRVYTAGWLQAMGSLPMVAGLETIRGGDVALLSPRHHPWLRRSHLRPAQLDSLAVGYLLTRGACGEGGVHDPALLSGERFCLRENRDALPRYTLEARVRRARDFDGMEAEMRRARPPRIPAVLAPEDFPLPEAEVPDAAAGEVEVLFQRPGHVALRTRAPAQRMLLVRESWSPGWSARVDGATAAVWPAAGLYFAVPVPPGEHQLRLDFAAPGARIGMILGALWLGLAAAALRRSPHSGRSTPSSGAGGEAGGGDSSTR